MTEDAANQDPALFAEPGGRWRSTVYGPLLCLTGALLELVLGIPVHWLTWLLVAVLLAGFATVQVLGARTHCVVELTTATLRQGTEELPVSDIAEVFDDPGVRAWDDETFDWESARALGESIGVPRRRTGIGLKLIDGRLVQAWAQDDVALRTGLEWVLNR